MRRWVLRTALYALRSSFLPGANWDEYASRRRSWCYSCHRSDPRTRLGFPFLQIRATATIGRYLHGNGWDDCAYRACVQCSSSEARSIVGQGSAWCRKVTDAQHGWRPRKGIRNWDFAFDTRPTVDRRRDSASRSNCIGCYLPSAAELKRAM